MLIQDLLLRNKWRKQTAIICGSEKITYENWCNASIELGKVIRKEINDECNNIGIFLPNSIGYAVAYFAIAISNHVIVPIHIKSSNSEIENTIRYCEIDMIVTSKQYQNQISDVMYDYEHKIKIVFIEDKYVLTEKERRYIRKSRMKMMEDEDDVIIMLHTSGSTSDPKKVMLTHNNLIANVESNIQSLKLDNSFKTLIALPMCFGYCNTSQFLTSVYLGVTMVIMNEIFMPRKFFKLVENEKITHFTAVPTMLNMLLKYRYYNNYDYSSLKIILFGGGKMSFNMLRKLNDRYSSVNFCQTYGQTECSPRVTLLEPIDSIKKIESVGKAIPGVEIIIVDRNGKEVKKEIIGEICVKGKNIMKGYYKHNELTKETIRNGWLKTGDLGYFDKEGYLYLVGRKKNIIISGGINIYPEEIEEIMGDLQGIKDVYVTGKDNELLGEVPYAYVVKSDETLSKRDIYDYCSEKMSYYKIPKDIIFVKELAKTKTGKIKRGQQYYERRN